MRERRLNLKYFDWLLVLCVFIIFIIGTLMVANATGMPNVDENASFAQAIRAMNKDMTMLHILWFGLGLLVAGVVIFFDYKIYGDMSNYLYWGSVVLLVLVLIFGGDAAKNAGTVQSWFKIGSRAFQPSEVSKIAVIIVLAKQLSKYANGIRTPKELLPILIRVGLPLVLIMLQPDYGTAFVYIFVTIAMLYAAGVRLWMLIALVGSGVAAIIPVWLYIMDDFQKKRILVFLDPGLDPWGSGYNVRYSKIAVGSGQLFGKGFFASDALSQLSYIPVQYSDFIFAVTAETWGFIGASIVVLLYCFMIIRMLWLAKNAFDRFGRYMIIGVVAMVMFHIFENIGMTIGIMPVTGIPLPFLSYGGSNMLTNMIAIGLVLNVALRRKRGIFRKKEDEVDNV